jgi:hypothetical protein
MAERVSLSSTKASEIDLDTLPTGVSFVKLEDLVEVPIVVTDAKIVPSTFNPKDNTAQVQFYYEGADLEETDEDIVYQFSSQQRAIMKQVRVWNDEDRIKWGEQEVGPLAVTIYGALNSYGKYPMCLAEIIPEQEPAKSNGIPAHRDLGTDSARQQLQSKTAINTPRTSRPAPKR